jgi:DNA-directed RNA polymerase specialized sigma24 family protein
MKGKPGLKLVAPAARPATAEEILRAIDGLSDADNERLEQYAINRIHRIGRAASGRTHEDLLHDAVVRLMTGPRHWYPDDGVSFVVCLLGVVRSLSSAWAGRRKRSSDSPEYAGLESELSVIGDGGKRISPLEVVKSTSPNVEESAIEAAQISESKALADAIMADFAEDEPATYVLMGFEDGLDGPAIRAMLNMTEPQFRTVTRRIQRRAKKIMEEFYGR